MPHQVRRTLGIGAGDRLILEESVYGEMRVIPVRAERPFCSLPWNRQSGNRLWQAGDCKAAAGSAGGMTTAIDTNVPVALWDVDPELNAAAQKALD